jgi:hypothetical protein
MFNADIAKQFAGCYKMRLENNHLLTKERPESLWVKWFDG